VRLWYFPALFLPLPDGRKQKYIRRKPSPSDAPVGPYKSDRHFPPQEAGRSAKPPSPCPPGSCAAGKAFFSFYVRCDNLLCLPSQRRDRDTSMLLLASLTQRSRSAHILHRPHRPVPN